ADGVLVVRHQRVEDLAGPYLLASDDARDVEALVLHLRQALFELGTFGRAGEVVLDRLVRDRRRLEDPGAAHRRDSTIRLSVAVRRRPQRAGGDRAGTGV